MANPKGWGGEALANVSLRKQVWFAIVLIAAGLLLIEVAARAWLALSAGAREANDLRSGAVETTWFDILEQDLKTDPDAPRLYQPDPELFWRLRPDTALEVDNQVYQTRTRPRTWRIQINPEGQRGPASPRTRSLAPDRRPRRLLHLGFRVSEDETYPALLQANLREHGMTRAAVQLASRAKRLPGRRRLLAQYYYTTATELVLRLAPTTSSSTWRPMPPRPRASAPGGSASTPR